MKNPPSDNAETSVAFTYIVRSNHSGWQICRRYSNGTVTFVGGHNYAAGEDADNAAADMNARLEALSEFEGTATGSDAQ